MIRLYSLDSADVKRSRNLCKTAVVALVFALLTTPLTTLPLLQLADQPHSMLYRLADNLPFASRAVLVGAILLGFPTLATCLASLALQRVHSSWTPMAGGGLARAALTIGIISLIAAAVIFVVGLL